MSTPVRVVAPYQVCDAGVVYGPGVLVDVPDDLAQRWIAAGWVELVPPKPSATPAAATPARKRR